MAVAIGLAGSAAVVAAPVLPSVANFSAAPTTPVAGTKIGGAGRAGVKRSHDSSNIAPLFIGLGVLAAAGVAGGVAAATSGGGHSNNNTTVSP